MTLLDDNFYLEKEMALKILHGAFKYQTDYYINIKTTNVVGSKYIDEDDFRYTDPYKFSFGKFETYVDNVLNMNVDTIKKYNFLNDIVVKFIEYYRECEGKIFIIDFYKTFMKIFFKDSIFKIYIEDELTNIFDGDMIEVDKETYKIFVIIRKILVNLEEFQAFIVSTCDYYNMKNEIESEHCAYKYIDKKFKKYYNMVMEKTIDMINV